MLLAIDGLIATPDLDAALAENPRVARAFEEELNHALEGAFGGGPGLPEAHLFVQRTLYRVNRLSFFWYDALASYDNERSLYLLRTRQRIEERWQTWEQRQMEGALARLRPTPDVAGALRERAARDLAPATDARGHYFAERMDLAGYQRLLEIFSLDALVEASQMSRTLGGVANPIHAYMTRLLLEEYGGGRLHHKHSSYFQSMLDYFGMDARPEAYFLAVPWEVLAGINHSFLLSERKRWYPRYVGGLLYTETSTPSAFTRYRRAAERLGAPPLAAAYWTVHIKADAIHGRWMLEDVALPLAERYPREAWELLWGYDQQAFLADRVASAMLAAVQAAAGRASLDTPMLAHRPCLGREAPVLPPESHAVLPAGLPDVTYVLPIRQSHVQPDLVQELGEYLRSIRDACQAVVVVDGSAEPVFAAHHRAWADLCRHVQPDPRYRYLNGKVNGLLTGVDCATTDKVICGDDDVRYRPSEIRRLSALLDRFDYVKPQNYFDPLPMHARVETARMLVNRAVLKTGDYPGTCGFRKSVLERIGPYDGDVLFENEEMFRHFARNGASMNCANDFLVRRLPPTFAKFLEQRPRQSYEDLVMRRKTALFASFLPIGAGLVLAGRWRPAVAYFAVWSLAAIGLAARGRRGAAARVFPWSSCLFAVPWILERGVSVYVALFWRIARGGLPYWGQIVPKGTGAAFTPERVPVAAETSGLVNRAA